MELPVLEAGSSPMDLGDWLTLCGPVMRDLSPHSARWWERTLQEAQRFYAAWKVSTPLARVQIKAALPLELTVEPYVRTEQRGVSLLLKAVPQELKQLLVSNRDVSSTAILWRLLVTFQPGGAGEKGQLLKLLTSMSGGSTAVDLASSLRQWRRAFQRAREIGTSLPDGTLLIHGLEVAAVGLGKLDGQSAFRIASARSQLGVDECPDETNVLAYSQVLLAEAETLVLSGSAMVASNGSSGSANPKVKAVSTTSPTRPPGKPGGGGGPPTGQSSTPTAKHCKYWGTEQGCRQGRNCAYGHPQLPDFKTRCWNCSASGHQKAECPYRQGVAGGGGEVKPPTTKKAMMKDGKGDGKSEGKSTQCKGGEWTNRTS